MTREEAMIKYRGSLEAFPADFWQKTAETERQIAQKPQFPPGPFCANDYAKFCGVRPRTARERLQKALAQQDIRVHLWVMTTHGRVPYYIEVRS